MEWIFEKRTILREWMGRVQGYGGLTVEVDGLENAMSITFDSTTPPRPGRFHCNFNSLSLLEARKS